MSEIRGRHKRTGKCSLQPPPRLAAKRPGSRIWAPPMFPGDPARHPHGLQMTMRTTTGVPRTLVVLGSMSVEIHGAHPCPGKHHPGGPPDSQPGLNPGFPRSRPGSNESCLCAGSGERSPSSSAEGCGLPGSDGDSSRRPLLAAELASDPVSHLVVAGVSVGEIS